MSTLPDYTDYQLEETKMILRKLDPPLYNITKGIPWIAQKWLEIQQYLLTENIYLIGEAPSEAPSSREVSFEPESDKEEDNISEDGQEEEEEEDIFNPKETSHTTSKTSIAMTGKNFEDKGKSRSTSIIDTMTGGSQSKSISLIDTVKRQKSSTRGSSKSQSASQTKETTKPCHMTRGSQTKKKTA